MPSLIIDNGFDSAANRGDFYRFPRDKRRARRRRAHRTRDALESACRTPPRALSPIGERRLATTLRSRRA
ncbi:MAG: hypothetical protein C4334_08385 [Pyrinomonas sp.]